MWFVGNSPFSYISVTVKHTQHPAPPLVAHIPTHLILPEVREQIRHLHVGVLLRQHGSERRVELLLTGWRGLGRRRCRGRSAAPAHRGRGRHQARVSLLGSVIVGVVIWGGGGGEERGRSRDAGMAERGRAVGLMGVTVIFGGNDGRYCQITEKKELWRT